MGDRLCFKREVLRLIPIVQCPHVPFAIVLPFVLKARACHQFCVEDAFFFVRVPSAVFISISLRFVCLGCESGFLTFVTLQVANGHGQQYPTEPPHNSDDDICLRSQVVSKSPHDRGLGIQLFTPSNGQGVRITKIDPMGPFGRTQAFEDGDVIVEIDGVPLLYGGHAAVLGAIQSAMSSPARQMNVTVCSPAELSKLEALVDDASDDSSTAGKTSASAAETTTPPRRTTGGWGKILVESTKKLTKSMSVFALGGKKPATPTDGTTGTLRGAPAWWKDSAKKKPAADNTTPAKNGPTGTGGGDGAVARELQYGGEQTFASQHDAIVIDEPAYLIYRADIHDLEAYKQDYMSRTTEIIAKFGGRWLARGGKVTTLEGSSDSNEHNTVLQRMVLIEFPSMQAAKVLSGNLLTDCVGENLRVMGFA